MFKNVTKGFTLIELLVVIAIIGILSSVVLASLNDARQKSRDAKRVADIKQLQLALQLYFDSTGSYPVQETLGAIPTALAPQYIAAIPVDPIPSSTGYEYAGSANDFILRAELENDTHPAMSGSISPTATLNGTPLTGSPACGGSSGFFCVKP